MCVCVCVCVCVCCFPDVALISWGSPVCVFFFFFFFFFFSVRNSFLAKQHSAVYYSEKYTRLTAFCFCNALPPPPPHTPTTLALQKFPGSVRVKLTSFRSSAERASNTSAVSGGSCFGQAATPLFSSTFTHASAETAVCRVLAAAREGLSLVVPLQGCVGLRHPGHQDLLGLQHEQHLGSVQLQQHPREDGGQRAVSAHGLHQREEVRAQHLKEKGRSRSSSLWSTVGSGLQTASRHWSTEGLSFLFLFFFFFACSFFLSSFFLFFFRLT